MFVSKREGAMSSEEPKKFKGKDEIKEFLESVAAQMGIERDMLAEKLGISTSAFYGYITRREIPQKSYKKLLEMQNGKFQETVDMVNSKSTTALLNSISLDELVAEIERRGWLVDLKRNPTNSR